MKNKKLFTIISIIVVVSLSLIAIYYFTQTSNSKDQSKEEDINITNDLNVENEQPQIDIENIAYTKFFYAEKNNIFLKDIITNEVTKLTNYTSDAVGNNIQDLTIIDTNHLGFALCDSVPNAYACSINVLNIDSREIIEKERLNNNSSLQDLDFYDLDTFAYLYAEMYKDSSGKWIFAIEDGTENYILNSYNFTAYGRGVMTEDSQKIRFSQDGSKVFQIATSSPKAPKSLFDSNIYLYNLDDNTSEIIQNATQPIWLDNNTIIYRGYNQTTKVIGYLFSYNIVTKNVVQLENVPIDSYLPIKLDKNNIIFNEVGGIVSLYNTETNIKTNLLTEAIDISLISYKYILFTENFECNTMEDCLELPAATRNIYDIETKEVKNLDNIRMRSDHIVTVMDK